MTNLLLLLGEDPFTRERDDIHAGLSDFREEPPITEPWEELLYSIESTDNISNEPEFAPVVA